MDYGFSEKMKNEIREVSEMWNSLNENRRNATEMPKYDAVFTFKGKSNTEYQFKVFPIETSEESFFDSISRMFPRDNSGIYFFSNRHFENGKFKHTKIYLGKATDLYNRFYDHHTEKETLKHHPNCISVHFVGKSELNEIENDLLLGNDFPVNIQLQNE